MQGSPASPSRVPLPHSSAQVPRSLGTPGSESKPFIPPLPMTPSRVPLPQTTSQMPTSLLTPHSAESGLPPGFVPFIPPQGPPSTPSKVPLLQATGHTPFGLGTVDLTLADHSLPAGFVPQQGPPEILEAYAIKTPGVKSSGLSKTPQHSTNALAQVPNTLPIQSPSGFPAVHLAEYGLPANFVPLQGPPEILNAYLSAASKTPEFNTSGLPSRTPHKSTSGLPFEGSGNPGSSYTPAGIPLPMSTATATWGLPDNTTRGTGRTAYNGLPSAQAQPNFNYPTTPARMPLPASVVGSPQGSTTHQTPWSGWGGNGLAAGATPGAMPSELLGRPSSLYAGDGGLNKKVSSASLASSYKKFDPSTYVDPAYLASSSAEVPPDPTLNDQTNIRSRPGSVRSVRSTRSIKLPWGSPYAATIETITDDKII
ncbi:hypothetical protein K439DRAFT_42485 [Ramaria rubella]|nr:hypothetical protein K439DRAFT_42485 [Ramaria rubella]